VARMKLRVLSEACRWAVLLCVPLYAAPLLSGRVVDGAGKGIADVEARLAILGFSVTTDTGGAFEIDTPTGVLPQARLHSGPPQAGVDRGMLRVAAGAERASVRADLYDLHGRRVAVVFDGVVEAGAAVERALVREEMRLAKGTYIVKVDVNGQGASHKMMHMGSFTAAPSTIARGLAKAAAVVDTLLLAKQGCAQKKVEISAWNVDLGDIVLACGGVLPPEPPKSYSVPAGAVRVTNSTEFKDALSGGTARDIVLADGTYDNSSYFSTGAAHRLWAEHLGGATVGAGIVFGTGAGAEVHGIRFDVNSKSKVKDTRREGAAIRAEGTGHKLKVTDCWFDGHGVVGMAIDVAAINGFVAQRLVIYNFATYGIRVDDYPTRSSANPPALITDLVVSKIRNPDPSCCNGQAEFALSAGTDMTVERVRFRDIDWDALSPTIHCFNCVFRDVDIDSTKTAVYYEHSTKNTLLERFILGPHVVFGIDFEWIGTWGHGTDDGTIIQDGIINSSKVGIMINVCNNNETVRRVKFINQCFAAISDAAVLGYTSSSDTCPKATLTFTDNDYSGIDPGAKDITTALHQTSSCQ